MVPSACSDECARGAEGEAKARLRDLEAAPRPEKHAGTRHTHLTAHRYLTEGDLRVPVWRILAIFAPNDG